MVGYTEALTDPSYRGQLLCLTYPLVGNYGVPVREFDSNGLPKLFESDRIQVRGLIVHEHSELPSHYQSVETIDDWLRSEGIPGICGIDTRKLARTLRERGVMLGRLSLDETGHMDFQDPNKTDLVKEVSVGKPISYGAEAEHQVVLIDCGVKCSIIRNLLNRGDGVVQLPYDVSADTIMENEPAGVVISNGPGDPKACSITIRTIRELVELRVPILGICLGNQLIALAQGADTYKMKYGHRSQNQPVINLETGRCYITTQNHGYAVDKVALENAGLKVWFANANDHSIEGLKHPTRPVYGVQWHPEASPGPTDTEFIFDLFHKEMIRYAAH